MNALLHIADSALQYYRGRHTGLWGLIGLFIAFMTVAMWDLIQPIFEFTGVVSLLEKLGFIYEGAPEMTFFRIFIALVALYIVTFILGLLLLGIFVTIVTFSQSKLSSKILMAAFYMLVSPLFVIYAILWIVELIQNSIHRMINPKGYTEKNRLQKNYELIESLKYDDAIDGQNNLLSVEKATQYLNRLPLQEEHSFLLGITHDRDIFILLPKPTKLKSYFANAYEYVCISIQMSYRFNKDEGKKILAKIDDYEFAFDELANGPKFTLDEFEFIVIPKDDSLNACLESFSKGKTYYTYSMFIQNDFFAGKKELLKELSETDTATDHYEELFKKLDDFFVKNERTVRKFREQIAPFH